MKKQKYTKIDITLTDEEHAFIKTIMKFTNLSLSKVVTVILALYLYSKGAK